MTLLGFRRDDRRVQRIEPPQPWPPMLTAEAMERGVAKTAADEYGQKPRPPRTIMSMVGELENTANQFEKACRLVEELAALHRKLRAEILARLEVEDANLEARKIENERLRGRLIEAAAPAGEEKQAETNGGDHEAQ